MPFECKGKCKKYADSSQNNNQGYSNTRFRCQSCNIWLKFPMPAAQLIIWCPCCNSRLRSMRR